jgi:lipopolysaccharide biosynthesis protein
MLANWFYPWYHEFMKRLFLFAAYNPVHDIITDQLMIYLNALADLGDIVFFMDNNAPKSELKKLSKITLHADARRHGEYDFGSYKYAYIWARDNLDLSEYDMIYMVNDSVYAPLGPMRPILESIESARADAVGMVYNPSRHHPHIQTWFVGMHRDIANSKWFDEFMRGIKKQPAKGYITHLYEQGLTRKLREHNAGIHCAMTVRGRGIYNDIRRLYRRGLPFMKKVAFGRNNGALGADVLYILNHIDSKLRAAILSDAADIYGTKYLDWFLTSNPLRIIWRRIKHVFKKVFIEGI